MKRSLSFLSAAVLCACGARTSSPVSFSVSTIKPATTAAPAARLVVSSGLDVQRVRLVVSRLKLEGTASAPTATTDGGDDSEHEDGEVEFSGGPFLIDLNAQDLTGTVHKVFDAQVPEGTYRELRFTIAPPPSASSGTLADLAAQHASLAVDGIIDGQPFSFVSSLEAVQKSEGSFVVGSGTGNVTLAIDPSSWFGASAAARLDPRDPANKSAIEDNIRASFRVFQDDDGSGHENHSGDDGSTGSDDADGGSGHH